jgi:uncharacterized protein YciU (UPF0263 family)
VKVGAFTLIVPYYRNREMLRHQILAWEDYPSAVSVVLVDDGSPEPARDVLLERASDELRARVALYRIEVDIPWNRGGARNLGTQQAATDWIVHVDIDHVLPAMSATDLLEFDADPRRWYRFERYRVGRADETRRKDKIADDVAFGKIHPHIDSYLVTRQRYWEAGGYNEAFSGCLGGGTDFLKRLERMAHPDMVPPPAQLLVHTRDVVEDASDWSLSRDRVPGKVLQRNLRGRPPTDHIRFPWNKQDLCIQG